MPLPPPPPYRGLQHPTSVVLSSFVSFVHAARFTYADVRDSDHDPDYVIAFDAGLETGQEVLEERSMGDVDMWEELGKLFALMVGFRILGYLALRFMHRERLKID